MTIKIWGTYESPEAKKLKEKYPLMYKMDDDYDIPDDDYDIPDDVDETNYDPYSGCDMYEVDEMW